MQVFMQIVFKIECQLAQFSALDVARVFGISNFYQCCTCYFLKVLHKQFSISTNSQPNSKVSGYFREGSVFKWDMMQNCAI